MSETIAVTIEVSSLTKRTSFISILIIGLLFFIFGFVSWVNAILIPYFRIACELTNFQSYLVTFAFYISYFVMSIPSSYLLKKVGFKKGMMVGFWAMALGAFIFVPAALLRTYEVFLLGLFTIGAGLAVLQTAANPYITILKLPFSRTRKLGRGGFTTLRASRVRWRQVAPARQDRNAGETDGQKEYRTQVYEAVPRR